LRGLGIDYGDGSIGGRRLVSFDLARNCLSFSDGILFASTIAPNKIETPMSVLQIEKVP
jgi:hypothetical protein